MAWFARWRHADRQRRKRIPRLVKRSLPKLRPRADPGLDTDPNVTASNPDLVKDTSARSPGVTEAFTASKPGRSETIELDRGAISRRVNEAFDKVPEIGRGRRWYDLPYRTLTWLSSGWRRRLLTRRALETLNYGVNYLIPFNEHDRNKVWDNNDPLNDFKVPSGEHVRLPVLWVVELFPPSEYSALEETIRKNAWDRRRRFLQGRDDNREMLVQSRAGAGPIWWRLAEIAAINSSFWAPDGTREKLPPDFGFIELKAFQIGAGLTAVVGMFSLTAEAARKLDEVWHEPHEPLLVRAGRRPLAEDRQFAAFRRTQSARSEAHEAARRWLRERCPGAFASSGESQPLIDLLMMEEFDPVSGADVPPELNDAFRALGLTEHGFIQYTSTDLPKLALVPTELTMTPSIGSARTWALWGQSDAAVAAMGEMAKFYGEDKDRAVAHRYNEGVEALLTSMAISSWLDVTEARYAAERDSARAHHWRFNAKRQNKLRQTLLTLSLDLASMWHDVELYWKLRPHFEWEAEFTIHESDESSRRLQEVGRNPFEPVHFNTSLREQQKAAFDRLIDADKDYRDILSTVSSLGASAESSRLGRIALLVALVSLIVAVLALLLTDLSGDNLLGQLWRWVATVL
jgi:hypothetical protein